MKTVVIAESRKCNFCNKEAKYDGKTILGGIWAYMCPHHFLSYGIGLGLGKGQELIKGGERK